MARTPSYMLPLHTKAPDFNLLNTVTNTYTTLTHLKGKNGTVVLFICNHCPFVIHINKTLVALANSYIKKGISFIAISSNDIENYPQDRPELMKKQALKLNYPFPYLYDPTQAIAKAYKATCTPDIYLFNPHLKLVYRGQLDASRPGNNIPCTGEDLQHAITCLLENKTNTRPQKPSIGCNIKWKPIT